MAISRARHSLRLQTLGMSARRFCDVRAILLRSSERTIAFARAAQLR